LKLLRDFKLTVDKEIDRRIAIDFLAEDRAIDRENP